MARAPETSRWHLLARYWAFQAPGIALFVIGAILVRDWLGLSNWLVGGAICLWIGLDLVMFPFVKKAYEPRSGGGVDDLVGASGTARETLDPVGYVQIASELWRAELTPGSGSVEKGDRVRVQGVHGLTLVVVPVAGGSELENPGDLGGE